MKTIPKLISQNPYRILGVYANSTKKDIIANKGKATAFLKVNRPVEYPLDMKGILPPLERTLDSMNEAEAHLAIAREQIKYTQFWFVKLTSIDDVAFNHLLAGHIDNAMEIWSKQASLSSLQNRVVCYLIKNNPRQAVKLAEMLYTQYGAEYVKKLDANSTLQMTAQELLHQFIDTLGEEVGMQVLYANELGTDTKAYISSKTVEPLVNKILSEIERSKKIDHKDAKARIDAARTLVANTRGPFNQLKELLPPSAPQYLMVADKLGIEILQCAIDYFNNSKDDDAAHTAMKMQRYAQSIVVGTLAKQRCDENVKILQKIINDLPPQEVMAEDWAIKAELSKFVRLPDKISYAMTLLNNTKPHLQSIKSKLGARDEYYLEISTLVVSVALGNVIKELNSTIKFHSLHNEFLNPLSDYYKDYTITDLKKTLKDVWGVICMIEDFDYDNNFKQHYKKQRNAIKSLCNQLNVWETQEPSTVFSSPPTSTSSTTTTTSTPPTSPEEKLSVVSCLVVVAIIIAICCVPGLIWGVSSYVLILRIIGGISGLCALGGLKAKEPSGSGCLLIIAAAIIAALCFWGSGKLEDYKLSENKVEQKTQEERLSNYNTSNSYNFGTETNENNSDEMTEDSEEDNEDANDESYDDYSYKEVQYNTGDKPYLAYYGKGKYDKSTKNSLTIKNEYGRDAVVFLQSTSGKKIRHVYIKASNTYTMDNIPAGSYEVKIMQGLSWNPNKNNGADAPKGGFMKEVSMSKTGATDVLSYPASSSGQYGTYEMTLYKVQNGNMYTQNIDESQMFN